MSGERDPGREERRSGFVLVSVLALVVLFVTVSATYAVKARLLLLRTGNRIEASRLQALADGATLFAADALRAPAREPPPTSGAGSRTEVSSPLPIDGTPLHCLLNGDLSAVVTAVDQGGLLDLNAAPVAMIADVLKAAGIDWRESAEIVAEIADFRDLDDDPSGTGVGEAARYEAEGLAWRPRNAAFVDVEEIAQLPSGSLAAIARLRPLLTTDNENAGMDFSVMPPAARALLPERPEAVADLERWRMPSPRRRFDVTVRLLRADGSFGAGRSASVGFGEDRSATPSIRRWSRPRFDDRGKEKVDPSGEPFCAMLRAALTPVEAGPPQ